MYAVGCPVRIVKNLDERGRRPGLVNGALATVEAVDAAARAVTVRLGSGARHVLTETEVYSAAWRLADGRKLVDTCVCIPAELAFAATVHASQGATIDGALALDVSHPFASAALLYVGASRTKRLASFLPAGVCEKMAVLRPDSRAIAFLRQHGLDVAAETRHLAAESDRLLGDYAALAAAELEMTPADTARALRGTIANGRVRAHWPAHAARWDRVKTE